MTWRVGRSVGRTIYQAVGDEPSKADILIGLMDTPELAAAAVEAFDRAERQDKATRADGQFPWHPEGW